MKDYNDQLSKVLNPESGKSLTEESRWVSCDTDNGKFTVTYKRDGISSQNKRKIEDEIIQLMSNDFEADNIFVKTVSEQQNSTAPKASEKQAPESQANLKVGHGVNTGKKRVPNVKKVIAVSSCKGGVGKSTVTANLACSLAKEGKRVGVIDADIYGPSLPILLGKKDVKPGATEDKKIKPIQAHGISFISFGLFINEGDPVIWRGPMLGGVLNQFLFDTSWGELDYLILDLPPGTGDIQLSMVQNTEIDGVVVVTTPQDIATADTIKGIKMFEQVNVPVIGIIENMSYFCPPDNLDKKYHIFGEGGAKKLSSKTNVEFLGEIPLEIELRESADNGHPYMAQMEFEGRPVHQAYAKISKSVDKKLFPSSGGIMSKLFRM